MSDKIVTCPGCSARMAPRPYRGVEIDQCVGCRGVWFDTGELARAARTTLPPFVRTGASTRHCPTCAVPMVVGRLGPVEVDACGTCRGAYFDAGESLRLMTVSDEPVARSRRDAAPADPSGRTDEELRAIRRRTTDMRLASTVVFGVLGAILGD